MAYQIHYSKILETLSVNTNRFRDIENLKFMELIKSS